MHQVVSHHTKTVCQFYFICVYLSLAWILSVPPCLGVFESNIVVLGDFRTSRVAKQRIQSLFAGTHWKQKHTTTKCFFRESITHSFNYNESDVPRRFRCWLLVGRSNLHHWWTVKLCIAKFYCIQFLSSFQFYIWNWKGGNRKVPPQDLLEIEIYIFLLPMRKCSCQFVLRNCIFDNFFLNIYRELSLYIFPHFVHKKDFY